MRVFVRASSMLPAVFLCACVGNNVLDYTPIATKPPISDIITTAKVVESAKSASDNYEQWANNVASSVQVFEIPIIGTVIAAAAEISFSSAHKGPLTSLALAAGGLGIVDSYYNPRQRIAVYFDASQAMSCIARVAGPIVSAETATGDAPWTFPEQGGFTLSALLAAATDDQTKSTLKQLILAERNKTSLLVDGMEQINEKAVTRGLAQSTLQSTSAMASALKQAIQDSESLKQGTDTTKTTNSGKAATLTVYVGQVAMKDTSNKPLQGDIADALADPRAIALTSLQADIATCVLKAGS